MAKKLQTFVPAYVEQHADGKGMNMQFEHPDGSCEVGFKVTGAGVVYESLRYFDALLKFWELCKIRTDDMQLVRFYEERTEIGRYVIKAEFDDRARAQIYRESGLRTIKDVFGYIRSMGAGITAKASLNDYVKKNLTEGIDYTNKQLIWFTDLGLKKVFYNYLKINFF